MIATGESEDRTMHRVNACYLADEMPLVKSLLALIKHDSQSQQQPQTRLDS